MNVSLAAFVLATVSALLRAARGVWQHELVSVSLSPLRLVFWNGFWSGCITLVILGPNRNGILNGPAMSSICLCLVLFVIQRSFVTPPELLVLRPSMSSQLFRMMAASKEGLEGLRSLRTVSTLALAGLRRCVLFFVFLLFPRQTLQTARLVHQNQRDWFGSRPLQRFDVPGAFGPYTWSLSQSSIPGSPVGLMFQDFGSHRVECQQNPRYQCSNWTLEFHRGSRVSQHHTVVRHEGGGCFDGKHLDKPSKRQRAEFFLFFRKERYTGACVFQCS